MGAPTELQNTRGTQADFEALNGTSIILYELAVSITPHLPSQLGSTA